MCCEPKRQRGSTLAMGVSVPTADLLRGRGSFCAVLVCIATTPGKHQHSCPLYLFVSCATTTRLSAIRDVFNKSIDYALLME